MSMERNFQKFKVEPIPEGNQYEMPAFLKKTDSVASESSVEPGVENDLAPRRVGGGRDEGLGESFDQQSEVSDGSANSRAGNGVSNGNGGIRNSAFNAVPEENSPEDEAPKNLNTNASSTSLDDVNPELTLDPSKLPNFSNNSNLGSALSESTPDLSDSPNIAKKNGASKKAVSFLGSSGSGDDPQIEETPVSETFVYEGKPAKSGWGFLKKRSPKNK